MIYLIFTIFIFKSNKKIMFNVRSNINLNSPFCYDKSNRLLNCCEFAAMFTIKLFCYQRCLFHRSSTIDSMNHASFQWQNSS